MSIHLTPSVCLWVHHDASDTICLSAYIQVTPSVSVRLSVCLFVSTYKLLSVSTYNWHPLSVCLSMSSYKWHHLNVCLFVSSYEWHHLSVSSYAWHEDLSVCLWFHTRDTICVCLSVCESIRVTSYVCLCSYNWHYLSACLSMSSYTSDTICLFVSSYEWHHLYVCLWAHRSDRTICQS